MVSGVGGIILGIGFIANLIAYGNALKIHDQLTQVYNHPNARVASGKQAKKVMATVELHEKQSAFEKVQKDYGLVVKQIEETPEPIRAKIEKPTLKNLPPHQRKESNFNYSLCESIDYQQESLLPRATYLNDKQSSSGEFYTAEEVSRLLNQQRTELMNQAFQVQMQRPVFFQAAPQMQMCPPLMMPA